MQNSVHPQLTAQTLIIRKGARILAVVLIGSELQRIHKYGYDHVAAISARFLNQLPVPEVQGTHRRHKAHQRAFLAALKEWRGGRQPSAPLLILRNALESLRLYC